MEFQECNEIALHLYEAYIRLLNNSTYYPIHLSHHLITIESDAKKNHYDFE
jgi:hypothetical protein